MFKMNYWSSKSSQRFRWFFIKFYEQHILIDLYNLYFASIDYTYVEDYLT